MRKIALLALLPFAVLLPPAPAAAPGTVKAGVGVVDATWHVGASAGQYATDHPCSVEDMIDDESLDPCLNEATVDHLHNFDPNLHQTRRAPSYGVQSRNSVRVIVIEGADGTRVALMKNDLYIPQDLLNERIATILEEHDATETAKAVLDPAYEPVMTRINHANLTVAVSHSHSSPYYSTPSWGVWAFQDVFDIRFFEYMAQRSAQAVIQAAASMVPVKMGAITLPYDHGQRHSYGPAKADDGTPAGYPKTDNDKTISILRFDRATGEALAIFMTLGLHPEMLEGNNLITGEYVGALERMVEAETGATLIFAQNNTGTSEPDRNCEAHPCSARAEFSHREYGQAERVARSIADVVVDGFTHIGTPDDPAVPVPFSSDFPVGIVDRQFAPPYSHPYPSVSNCRSHEAFDGNPGVPIIGLPDCERITGGALKPTFDMLDQLDPGVTYNTLRAAGVPLPDNYSAPSYTGLQETFQVHLQAIRLGDVLITVCPCEQWADQSRNIKSRADEAQGNMWLGYEWPCTQQPNNDWKCPHPNGVPDPPPSGPRVLTISDYLYQRMKAQILNDAAGWDEITNTIYAEYEPVDVTQIKGNFTHLELKDYCPACTGYALVVPVGMANDYWGYLASYREYQRGDHYRKALTGLGPHSQDFMATRLVRMGAELQGGPEVAYNPLDLAYMVDGAHQHARAEVLGRDAQVLLAAYEALLPPDGGITADVVSQPQTPIKRFDATSFTWIGGSNYTDDPRVRVERLENGTWVEAGDMRGDVVVTLNFPETGVSSDGLDPETSAVPSYVQGSFDWEWTAVFEAFNSDIDTGRDANTSTGTYQTPAGTYRFVVDGFRRAAPATVVPYHLESDSFEVQPWNGIEVSELTPGSSEVTFTVGPALTRQYCPRGYAGTCASTEFISATVGPIAYPDTYLTYPYPDAPETGNKVFPREDRRAILGAGGPYLYCFPCTFRPWAQSGTVAQAAITVTHAGGATETFSAACTGGSCSATASLVSGDCVSVEAGQIIDTFGEINAAGTTPVCLP